VNQVRRWLEDHSQLAVDLLSTLCRQPSVSATGEGVSDMGPLLVEVFRSQGFEGFLVPTKGTPLVVARDLSADGDKTLLLYNHYDVQPTGDPAEWDAPPFEPTIVGDRLYARGATDNKGNIVSRIMACLALREVGQGVPTNIKFVVEGEEEIGSPNLFDALEQNREMLSCDWCIWEDTFRENPETLVVSLGSKAMCYLELECQVGPVDIHSAFAAAFENAAWRLVNALALIKDASGKVSVPGFYDGIVLLTEAEQKYLDKLPSLPDEKAKSHVLADSHDAHSARKALVIEPTCNIQGIHAGYTGDGHKNALLARAYARLDMRLVPGQDATTIARKIREWLDENGFSDVKIVKSSFTGKPSRYPPGNLVDAIVQGAGSLYEGGVAVEPGGAGCTPIWMVGEALGCHNTVNIGVGVLGSNTHAPNENVSIPEILRFAETLTRVISFLGESS
jgi:acetylornithine deacetylase/succinyl-diaminopimelate desuccinylase-like protein